jgi:hypothetical protein
MSLIRVGAVLLLLLPSEVREETPSRCAQGRVLLFQVESGSSVVFSATT